MQMFFLEQCVFVFESNFLHAYIINYKVAVK